MQNGERINDRYRIEQQIGSGGMANVYRAYDEILKRTVAVKVLRSEFSHNEQFIRRFEREAHAATSLNHPNIVGIYDVGDERDIYYIVMEYVDGVTLKQYLQDQYIPLEHAVSIMGHICDAIAHAHANRIIHRDIKPQNIMIAQNGDVKVTDFGIAVAMSSNATLTHTMSVLGSVHYFSPEQARGKFADEKSDIYSLGAVLYELVTGRVPFIGETPVAIALQHLQDTPLAPKQLNSQVPQALENCILQALEKMPGKRHASVDAFKRDCLTALSPERAEELPRSNVEELEHTLVMSPLPVKEVKTETTEEHEVKVLEPDKKKKRFWWLWVLLAVLLLGFSVIGYTAWDSFQRVEVPDVVGMQETEAVQALEAAELKVEIVERPSDNIEKGVVSSQNPQAGRTPKRGTEVTIIVSVGKGTVVMPDVEGMTQAMAERTLKDLGFNDIKIESKASDSVESGNVISQSIAADTNVLPNEEAVTLIISTGSDTVTIADLSGYTYEEASQYASQNKLKIVKREEFSEDVTAGQIIRQLPTAGSGVKPGAELTVVVSKGPEESEVTVTKTYEVEVAPPAEGEEPSPVEVVITTKDTNGENVTRETITETETFEYTLILNPGDVGEVSIEVDGEVVKTETVTYEQAKNNE